MKIFQISLDLFLLTDHLAQSEHDESLLLSEGLHAEEDADGESDDEEEVAQGSEKVGEKPGEIFSIQNIFQLKDESYSYGPEEAALLGLLIFLLPRILDVHKGRVTVRLLDVGVGERTLVAEHVVVHRLLGGWK